ncbi:DUF262 domain-containing protein [Flavobacterium pallidum]|uniref:DUF262 domain-containing protein n=1 Tax=Flavobacterium pallidum TaxID=2172098 RepID=A0A2S1SHB1_9FLAO|nr:DUF262 domain-containing protein [Flavobacterium pallidum]AWI25798.1 hypothetical protein HYN49_07720 [Flavobacterium pallidum]
MSNFIYSVAEVFDSKSGFLSQNKKTHYNIPEYQRGYKWSENEVTTLLDDIFKFQGKQNEFYCLQNITLVNKSDSYFNVVDGQQRLTTLYIILSFLGEKELIRDKLSYPQDSIRSKTFEFQTTYILDRVLDVYRMSWDEFNTQTNGEFNYQDIFYLCSTCRTVNGWFEDKEDEYPSFKKEKFSTKILENVKFIVNNLKDTDEEKVFGNVNSKRIPLDGSDLIRAILITKVAKFKFGHDDTDQKLQIKINEERVRIGWELDELNNWWSNKETKSYFSSFITQQSKGDIKFDSEQYPINNLYYLFAQTKGKSLEIQFIEGQLDIITTYLEIIKLHNTLTDWYNDKYIYHFLGYIFNQLKKDASFKEIYKLWNQEDKTRQKFIDELKGIIREGILGKFEEKTHGNYHDFYKDKFKEFFPTSEDPAEFLDQKDWYDEALSQKELIKILLLLDIIHVTKQQGSNLKLPAIAFHRLDRDIEHIFPKTPKSKNASDFRSYIEFINKYRVENESDRFNIEKFEEKFAQDSFRNKIEKFVEKFTDDVDTNSIGNLVLLDSSVNRSIQNNPYSKKRLRLIQESNEGNFIHPHTFNVFVRAFQDESSIQSLDLEHWTNVDVENSFKSIKEIIFNYLL